LLKIGTLPGEGASHKVHENVSQGFHVIPPRLLNPHVGVDGGIPCRSSEILRFMMKGIEKTKKERE